ncbi:putative transcription factor interactor and regulator CCHC(Zn) family [Helianthus annuus]|nr:putative transcription factor interactor and regulator CCHC(Zn) family [Helianthus annuus]
MLQGNCVKLKSENVKLLSDLNSLTSENKVLKEKEKDFERKKKSSENEDFWIKLEKKNLKANETKFQEQIKGLENEKSILENIKIENEKIIKSHFERISQLENEAKNSRNKIDELEKKLKGFVTSSEFLNHPCPKPINSVPISDNVTNFDKVKIEDCDEKSDDENEKIKKKKLFSKLNEIFQETVLHSTEKGECSTQKPVKKNVKQKQKEKNLKNVQKKNKSSSDQSSNRNQKLQKIKNQNSKIVGNEWCRFDHSASKPNPVFRKRDEYHRAKQCYDLSIWSESGEWYDNRVCYTCGVIGHVAVNCQSWSYEMRRCLNCQIKGHIARDCPMRSKERSRAKSQKMVKKPVKEKPKEQKVPETKVKLSQGQKDRLRKKRKKAREYLEKILSSDTTGKADKSSDKSSCSPKNDQSSKTDSSDTNLRTKGVLKKEKVVNQKINKTKKVKFSLPGDEFVSQETKEPCSGNESGSPKPEEPFVEVKIENSGLTMDDAIFPPLLNKNSKSPKDCQAWVNLFK